jgi:hypothetical protein
MTRRWIGMFGLSCLLAAGCAAVTQETANPEPAIQSVRAGSPLLRCREPCLAAWRSELPKAQALAASKRWRDLVALLARVGYQDDLTLYYLAEAAQGLGYSAAAEGYYRQSVWLSDTAMACGRLSRQCGGIGLPQAARLRLAALDSPSLRPSRAPSPPGPAAGPAAIPPAQITTPPVAAPAPEEAAIAPVSPMEPAAPLIPPLPQEATTPVPPPREAAVPVSPPRETVRPRAGEDYIEPPPANR